MEHCSALKRNEVLVSAATLDELWKHYDKLYKPVTKTCMIPLIWNIRISKPIETEHRMLDARNCTENVLELYTGGGCTT